MIEDKAGMVWRIISLAIFLGSMASCQRITFDYANTPAAKDKPKYSVVFPSEVAGESGQMTVISPNLPVSK